MKKGSGPILHRTGSFSCVESFLQPSAGKTPPESCISMGSTPDHSKYKRHPEGCRLYLEQDTGVEPAFTAWET